MPKHKRNHKKKNKKNKNSRKNKQHPNEPHKNKSKHHSKSNKSKPNENRIKHVIDIKIKKPSNNPPSSPTKATHSPIKPHYYDADISDSDTNHHYNLSPPRMQILRSAKIAHRTSDNSSSDPLFHPHSPPTSPLSPISPIPVYKTKSNPNISYLSPSFNRHHTPSFISQHPLSPLPNLQRAASSPIATMSHSPRSILRSRSSDSDSNSVHNVTFGAVEVHEFNLLAGSESDGVPEDGGYSLYLAAQESNNAVLDIDQYEKKRYQRWRQRAQHLHWNKKKLHKAMEDPQRYLFTAGRCDEFYSALTAKERQKRLSIDRKYKKEHCAALSAERMELDKIRSSRRKNNIFCNCKALSAMSTSELKVVAQQYGIKVYKGKKVKKGFLINRLRAKVSSRRDICCWDAVSCSCVAAGIDCHSGTQEGNFQCGCVKFDKKCSNEFGRYVYRQPDYARAVIREWEECYQDMDGDENENNDAQRVSFEL